MSNWLKSFSIILISLAAIRTCYSVEYLDTKGKDFWFTFLPNSHRIAPSLSTDSLYIFISSEKQTRCNIDYYDRTGNFYSQPITITQPNTLYTFKLKYYDYELWGYKTNQNQNVRYESESVSNLSFHVTSDDEITVYAHSQAKNTSDAFLVMPSDVLDKNYIIASFNSDGNKSYNTNGNGPMPSQFAVIATEDNTNVTINPKAETEYYGNMVQRLYLNKGEVYLIQAKIDASNLWLDLTGSTITADKPIAVFSGHQKALIPSLANLTLGSRDCLIEQMPPIKVLGTNAFITPFMQPSNVSPQYNDLYRIIAAYDNTTININGVEVAALKSGEFYQDDLTSPATVTANAPFLLTQYKKSSDYNGGNNQGDPFMLVVPPAEQFMNSYTTINVQVWENSVKVYNEQYITIVIPSGVINSFRMDGKTINAKQFNAIPYSNYSYANIAVSDGIHTTKADSAFGIYIYGYGTANSFGYTGGMSFAPIDFQPPQILTTDSCYKVSGVVYDSTISDSGLETCISPDSSKHNCTVIVDRISADGRKACFKATLVDRRFDGSFTIIATDSTGRTNIRTIDIKGFTLGLNRYELLDTLLRFEGVLKTGVTKCYDIVLHNYGKFEQTISDYSLLNKKEFNLSTSMPFVIKPDKIDTLTVCFKSDVDGIFTDTLLITGECADVKSLAEFRMETGHDKEPPVSIKSSDSCNREFMIYISDSTKWDSGISDIRILDTSNCEIKITYNKVYYANLSIKIIDVDEDMYFSISIMDSAGNQIFITDTVRSSKIRIFDIDSSSYGEKFKIFGYGKIGKIAIDSIKLYNTGISAITLDNVILKRNIFFSIPQSQFPLILNPNDSVRLLIYFHPVKANDLPYFDTLLIDSYCINQVVILSGVGEGNEYVGLANCDVKIRLNSTEIQDDHLLSALYPNPFSLTTTIQFTLIKSEFVTLKIYNSFGQEIETLVNGELKMGSHNYQWNAENKQSGVYYYVLDANNRITTKTMILIK